MRLKRAPLQTKYYSMKPILFAFFFSIQIIGLGQQISFEDDFTTAENWVLTTPAPELSASNNTLNLKTTNHATSTVLFKEMIDFSKDFSISFDIVSIQNFRILLNATRNGIEYTTVEIGNEVATTKKWGNRKYIDIKDYKFNPSIKLGGIFHVNVKQVNSILSITLQEKGSERITTIFSGTYPIEPGNPMFGFSSNVGRPLLEISISNFSMKYHPKVINVITNHEAFGEKINLGKNVNGVDNEIVPIISADGTQLIYTVDNGQGQVSYYSNLENGNWSEKKIFSEDLKALGKYHSIVALSADQNTGFMNGKWENGVITGKGISKTERTSTGWSTPQHLPFYRYETTARLSNSMSSDQRYVIASLKNDECYGEKEDLFVFFHDSGMYWRRLNLGKIINTTGEEITPFLAPDNKTLYFSSDGHFGYGSFDIFMSRRLDETWTNWSKPENLGPKINSNAGDIYYSVSAKGDYAYLATQFQSEGGTDIVRVELPPEARPEKMIIVKGRVLNSNTKEPIAAAIKFNDINTNTNNGIGNSDPATGNYQVVLPYGKVYQLYAEQKGYYALSEQIDLSGQGDFKIIEKDIYLSPIKIGEVFRLNNIFFETASAALKSESNQELDRLVKFLNDNDKIKIKITGHTDDVGTDKDNLELSKKRAAAVMQYLSDAKIPADRMSSEGLGEGKPLKSNDTAEGKAINRRVEFTIVSN